ncbi:MAG: hypothetical protein V8Q84_12045 [Bilophila sp.]
MGYYLKKQHYIAAGQTSGRSLARPRGPDSRPDPLLSGVIPAGAALFGSFGVKDEKELGRQFDVLVRPRLPLWKTPKSRDTSNPSWTSW